MVNVDCSSDQKVRFTASPTTASGKSAALDGSLQAEIVSGNGTVEAGAGQLDVVVRPSEAGVLTGRVFADADLGAGIVTIEESFTVNVTGAMAANLGVTAVVEPA